MRKNASAGSTVLPTVMLHTVLDKMAVDPPETGGIGDIKADEPSGIRSLIAGSYGPVETRDGIVAMASSEYAGKWTSARIG